MMLFRATLTNKTLPMETTKFMIEADSLTKHYGQFSAIQNVTFSVPRGQVAAFLGPNGAGKSTTLKILTGYLAPTSGKVRIAGFDLSNQRKSAAKIIGYLPENGPLYLDMTPASLLSFFAEARGILGEKQAKRIEEVSEQFGITQVLHKPIYKLSKGYRQRVGMAQVLLHEPDVLIMDEPTAGLDPNQIRDVRAIIRELGKTKTVLLSTHILQEVDAVADRVIFIHEGKIVFDGKPSDMNIEGKGREHFFHHLTGALETAEEPIE